MSGVDFSQKIQDEAQGILDRARDGEVYVKQTRQIRLNQFSSKTTQVQNFKISIKDNKKSAINVR